MKYPHYKDYRTRLESFKEWPPQLKPRPGDLAAAGFFYLGSCDHVWCFSCGGCLGRWEAEDDPWEEHARWYSDCDFLKLCEREVAVTAMKLRSETKLDVEQREISGTAISSISEAIQVASRDPMDCPAAQRVLAMGYHSEIIVQAMQIFENRNWHFNFSATDLLNIIFENENVEIKPKEKPDILSFVAHNPASFSNMNGTNQEEQSDNKNGTNRGEQIGSIIDTNRGEQSGNISRRQRDNRGFEVNNTNLPRDSLSTLFTLHGEIRN